MRIGVYSPNWIGDAVMALPFIQQLRIQHERAEIIIFCKEWVSAIYDNHSFKTKVKFLKETLFVSFYLVL